MISILFRLLKVCKSQLAVVGMKAFILTFLIILFASSGFYYFESGSRENLTYSDSVWWAIVSMTTVGYGDYFPQTFAGRFLIGIPTMVLGISVFGYVLSEVATKILESKSRRLKGMCQLDLENHLVIFNYSEARISQLTKEFKTDLKTENIQMVLVDEFLDEIPKELLEQGFHFIKGIPSHDDTLKRACIDRAQYVVILAQSQINISSDDKNLGITLMIRQKNKNVPIVCECIDSNKSNVLETAGATATICVSNFTCNLLVQELIDPGIKDVIEDLTSNGYGQQMYIIPIVSMRTWAIKEIQDHFNSRGYIFIGTKKGKNVTLNPNMNQKLGPDDHVVLIGEKRPSGKLDQ